MYPSSIPRFVIDFQIDPTHQLRKQIEENASKLQFAIYHNRLIKVKYFADRDFHFIKENWKALFRMKVQSTCQIILACSIFP